MDAFDPIRDTAVRLHTEFVMRGADPVWSKNSHSIGFRGGMCHRSAKAS
jgi:hypothetical protein